MSSSIPSTGKISTAWGRPRFSTKQGHAYKSLHAYHGIGLQHTLKEAGWSYVCRTGMQDAFWFQGMQGSLKNELDCIKAFSETDFTEDLKQFDVPTLIIHGDDDQIVPIDASARRTAQLVQGAILKIYAGGDHGLAATHQDQLNPDLLAFITVGTSAHSR